MADRPILFSGPMVRALLAGTKTQTRRLIPQATQDAYDEYDDWCRNVSAGVPTSRQWEPDYFLERARIQPGDHLWVREAWRTEARFDDVPPSKLPRTAPIYYAADPNPRDSEPGCAGRLRASMHMPRWASRLSLTVTDVRVQRLHEISEEDARAEGVSPLANGRYYCSEDEDGVITCRSAITAYAWLWNSINGEGGWLNNPWVAAYTFIVARHNIDAGGAA